MLHPSPVLKMYKILGLFKDLTIPAANKNPFYIFSNISNII